MFHVEHTTFHSMFSFFFSLELSSIPMRGSFVSLKTILLIVAQFWLELPTISFLVVLSSGIIEVMKVFTVSSALLPLAACAFCPTEHRQSPTFAHGHSSTPSSVILQSSRSSSSSSDVQLSQEDQEEQVSVPPSRPLEPQTEQEMSISIPFLASCLRLAAGRAPAFLWFTDVTPLSGSFSRGN